MKLITIGTGHGKPEQNRKYTSLLLEVNENYYIIDAGTCVEEYMISQQLPVEKIKSIFITHAHMDHMGSLPLLASHIISRHSRLGACLYLPEQKIIHVFENYMSEMTASPRPEHIDWKKESLLIRKATKGLFYEDENIKVWGIKTDHMDGRDTYAYMVEAEGKQILFTGDLSADMHDYPEILFEKEFEAVICEFTHMHSALEKDAKALEKLSNTRAKRFIFHHIHPYCELLVRQKRLDCLCQKVEYASDGESFEI